MKLIGSNTEDAYRAQLVASRNALLSDPAKRPLLAALRRMFPDFRTGYVLSWTPDQGEDFFTVLINTDRVAVAEVDRLDPDSVPVVEELPMASYLKRLSKTMRIKLAVAIELANADAG